jgi:hypothetical protein
MLNIYSGSIEKVKAEMKQVAKWKADEIKSVKSQIKSWKDLEKKAAKEENRKENPYPKEWDQKLKDLQILKDRFSYPAVPVRVGDIVINYAVYLKAFSKLKDLEIYPETVAENEMLIHYKDGTSKGKIHLYDVSELFKEIKSIPSAEIKADA